MPVFLVLVLVLLDMPELIRQTQGH